MGTFSIPEVSLYRIKFLDDQHQELIDLVESLNVFVDTENCFEVEKIFGKLRDLLIRHFSDEEALMKETEFPDVAQHSVHHQELLVETERILTIILGRGSLTNHDIDECVNKVLRHMFLSDGPFNTHLHSIGYVEKSGSRQKSDENLHQLTG